MEYLTLARVIHVLAIVVWIGGVSMVTTVLIPAIKRMKSKEEQKDLRKNRRQICTAGKDSHCAHRAQRILHDVLTRCLGPVSVPAVLLDSRHDPGLVHLHPHPLCTGTFTPALLNPVLTDSFICFLSCFRVFIPLFQSTLLSGAVHDNVELKPIEPSHCRPAGGSYTFEHFIVLYPLVFTSSYGSEFNKRNTSALAKAAGFHVKGQGKDVGKTGYRQP